MVTEKPAGKRSLGRPRHTWHIAVKMDRIEIGGMQIGFIWLRLRGRWRDFVNTTTIFQVLENSGNFLDSLTNCKILKHGCASWCTCGRPDQRMNLLHRYTISRILCRYIGYSAIRSITPLHTNLAKQKQIGITGA